MVKYNLKEVKTKSDEKAFLNMPNEIYKNDPNWVRPLDNDIKKIFDPKKNVFFEQGDAARWVAYDENNKMVGRIAAFYNAEVAANEAYPTGGCGFFESIDSQELANLLLNRAKSWLEDRGMKAMDGPVNFGDRDVFWGLLVEGFHPPVYNMTYNPPYYKQLFENYGFKNYFEQYSFVKYIIEDTEVSQMVIEKSKRLLDTGDFEFRHINKSDYPHLAEMFRTVYNKAWSKFSGVKEMTKEKAQKLFKTMQPVIDDRLIYFAFYKGEAIGFFIMLPNLAEVIKPFNGKFNLLNQLRFIYRLKVKKVCNSINAIVFGVAPEFQGKGIESGIINAFRNTFLETREYEHIELQWIGDFNPLMIRMIEKYVQAKRYKTHITYRYIFDDTIEFERCPKVSISRG